MTQTITEIPIGSISANPTNPRKTFDAAKLEELAASITVHGVLQPIIVRAITPTKAYSAGFAGTRVEMGTFEIVAGERRWRAAKLAKLKTMPCVIRELSDKEIAEIQLIENEQRDDVLPSEQAAAYDLYLKRGGKVEDLAAKIGKSVPSVRGILALNRLPELALKYLDEKRIPPSVAQLIARVPGKEAQLKVTKKVLAGSKWVDAEMVTDEHIEAGRPLSYRDTKEMISEQFMVELKGSPFRAADKKLDPDAGSCVDCPKRTGNIPEYEDSRADVCTDPECFTRKCRMQVPLTIKAATKQGVIPLGEKDVSFVGNRVISNEYAKTTDTCWMMSTDDKTVTYGDVQKEHDLTLYLAHTEDYYPIYLVRIEAVREILPPDEDEEDEEDEGETAPRSSKKTGPEKVSDFEINRRLASILQNQIFSLIDEPDLGFHNLNRPAIRVMQFLVWENLSERFLGLDRVPSWIRSKFNSPDGNLLDLPSGEEREAATEKWLDDDQRTIFELFLIYVWGYFTITDEMELWLRSEDEWHRPPMKYLTDLLGNMKPKELAERRQQIEAEIEEERKPAKKAKVTK
jgi:ParB/RepB/Spo0J family partition protein